MACTRFIPEISPPESVDDPISVMIGIIFLALFSMPLMLFWAPVFPSIVFMSGGMCFVSAWLPVFSMALRAVAMENEPNLTLSINSAPQERTAPSKSSKVNRVARIHWGSPPMASRTRISLSRIALVSASSSSGVGLVVELKKCSSRRSWLGSMVLAASETCFTRSGNTVKNVIFIVLPSRGDVVG